MSVVQLRPDAVQAFDYRGEGYLNSRGISRSTAEACGAFQSKRWFRKLQRESECLAFPYYDPDGNRVLVKYRSYPEKDFSADGNCDHFMGIHDLAGKEPSTVVIVEGEFDYLTLKEVDPELAVLSVPSGASQIADGAQIPYLWNARHILDKAKKILIGTDNDHAGNPFGDELARRLGRYRCWRVKWGEGCKDANDTLVEFGNAGIFHALENAEPYPVDGLYTASHFFDKLDKVWDQGLGKGASTGIPNVDEFFTVVEGQLTVVSGVPNSGKSQVIDNMMINLAQRYGWKFAVASFENPPFLHIANLASMKVEKDFFETAYGPKNRMTRDELEQAKSWINEHFHFIQQEDGGLVTPDSLLERLRVAVLRYGVRGAVIDPYNYISKPRDINETEFVSDILTRLKAIASAYGIHIWLVAHPTKLPRQSDGSYFVPGGYEISGSANFANKADNGFSIGRAPDGNLSEFKVWKTRYAWTGKNGSTWILWDAMRHIYVGGEPPVEDDF